MLTKSIITDQRNSTDYTHSTQISFIIFRSKESPTKIGKKFPSNNLKLKNIDGTLISSLLLASFGQQMTLFKH